ncbi:tyrosine-type recombinase/integrase [Limosilactobacillus reuteri]
MANFMKRGKKWQARITWRDSDGKLHQKSKSGFDTKQQAKQYAAELETKRLSGRNIEKDPTFSEYFEQWHDIYKKPSISSTTDRHYTFVKNIIEKYFKDKKLKKITRSSYQRFINEYGAEHAPETVKKINTIIKACVKSAVIDGILSKNFAEQVNLVANKDKERQVEYLSVAELKKLKNQCLEGRSRHFTSRYMILTAIYTGMRPEEIKGLTWNDINFKNHTIDINKAWDSDKQEFKPTKNESSNRIVRVNLDLLNVLSELKANHTKMIFEDQFGTIPTSTAYNKTLRAIMKKAEIQKRGFQFYSLRHCHVAYLLSQGVDLYIISKRLGHSNTTITTKVYAYLIDEYKIKSDDQIEKYLQKM